MHKRSTFWKKFGSQSVDESPKTTEIDRKPLLSYFLIIMSQIQLEKIIFSQIWDFRTAC